MNKAKIILIVGALLICYGYLCRAGGIYFFWESLSIGWDVVFVGLVFLFARWIKARKREKKKYLWQGIGMGLFIFILLLQTALYIVVANSGAYAAAKRYVAGNSQIRNETGNIKGFGIIPTGSISMSSGSRGETGEAQINILVKGERKYRELTLDVVKAPDSNWQVVSAQ